MRETVDVVVGHEAYDHVWDHLSVLPGFAFARLREVIDLVVVEHLRGIGFRDLGEGFGEGRCEWEVFNEVDSVCLFTIVSFHYNDGRGQSRTFVPVGRITNLRFEESVSTALIARSRRSTLIEISFSGSWSIIYATYLSCSVPSSHSLSRLDSPKK